MAVLLPKVLLIALSLLGFWTLWGFPYQNGLLKFLAHQAEPGAVLPGPTPAPMKQHYVGVGRIDKQLTILVSFFHTAVDGNRADISLSFLGLGGQVLGAWVLITIESLRRENKGRFILTATTLLGLGVAIVGYACVAPLWFAAHLWLSPTVLDPKEGQLLFDDPTKLAVVPFSIMVGFGVPSVLMTLPAPTIVSFETKQTLIAIQQGWPLWIGITQLILSTIISAFGRTSSGLTESEKKNKSIKYLRRAYMFSILSSTGSYVAGLALSGLAYAFPILFTAPYSSQLQPKQIYSPVNPFGSLQAKTLQEGALWFLQWDLIVAVVANVIWGLTVKAGLSRERTTWQALVVVIKQALITIALGPSATAAVALWTRDEAVFRGAVDSEKKSN